MKFYAAIFIVIASMFMVIGCTKPKRSAEVVEIVPVQPIEKYVTLEMGKSTFDDVRSAFGDPETDNASSYGKSVRTSWRYKLHKQNVIMRISVVDKNGIAHNNVIDLRKTYKSFRVYFNDGVFDRVLI